MEKKQSEPRQSQAFQALLDRFPQQRFDFLGRRVAEIALAGDPNAIRQAATEGLADDPPCPAVTVTRRQVDQVDPGRYCLMHGGDAFVECGFTPHHADTTTTERQRRDRPKLTKAVLPHDCHLPRRFGFAIRSKPPRSMSFAGDAILSARLLSSTTADIGPEVVINL